MMVMLADVSASLILPHPPTPRLPPTLTSLHDVVSIEPGNGNASFSLGLIYYDLQNHTEAERWFLRSLELAPNDAGSLYNLGVMFTELSKYKLNYLGVCCCHGNIVCLSVADMMKLWCTWRN